MLVTTVLEFMICAHQSFSRDKKFGEKLLKNMISFHPLSRDKNVLPNIVRSIRSKKINSWNFFFWGGVAVVVAVVLFINRIVFLQKMKKIY